MTQAAHSKIGASSMYRWAKCPGSVALCLTVPNQSSEYAKEGQDAHALAEAILRRELFGKKSKESLKLIAEASQEMSDAVQVYVDFVLDRAKDHCETQIEHRFDLSELHPGLFGTADCVIYDPEKKHLLVADYKHGAGILVNPERNSQLMYYGLGALLTLKYPCKTVELAIVQPRCGNSETKIRSWELPSLELIEFSADLVDYAKATEVENAPLESGDHCRFCPAQGVCPKLREEAQALAVQQFGAGLPYEPAKLSEVLTKLSIIEDWARGVREFAYREVLAGRKIPGWKLVGKRGQRKWTMDDKTLADSLLDLGIPEEIIFEAPQVRSVAQMEKKLRNKRERDLVLGQYVSQVSSGSVLVEESDKRPSVIVSAEEDFKVLG